MSDDVQLLVKLAAWVFAGVLIALAVLEVVQGGDDDGE
jgi:hypothetical protein